MSKPGSNIEWRKWGEVDPLFGVASWAGKERGGEDPWTDEAFFTLGRSDWQDFFDHWQRYGLDPTACLEIGCGAGRITMHLAKAFETTHAVDISPEMIAYARRHISDPTVHFYVSDGVTLPLASQSVSAVFSTHVFQHFDTLAQATNYFAEIARVLAPGGSLMIHLPIHHWPSMSSVFNILYGTRKALGTLKARIKRQLIRWGLSRPMMRGLSYPRAYLFTTLPRLGFENIEIAVFAAKSNNSPHPFVLAHRREERLPDELKDAPEPG